MKPHLFLGLAAALLLAGCARPSKTDSASMTLADFQARAAQFNNRITAPTFETTPEAVRQSLKQTIADANTALDSRTLVETPGDSLNVPRS